MKKCLAAIPFLYMLASCTGSPGRNDDSKSQQDDSFIIAFENGKWFDGRRFVLGDRYVSGGTLWESPREEIDTVIDLRGRYVVPPYADGHNHLLETPLLETYIEHYLYRGVFYLKDQSNILSVRREIEEFLNQPDSIDFISANQGFTGPGGHPLQIFQQLQSLDLLPTEWTMEDLEGNGIFVLGKLQDLDDKWPRFLEGNPDFVKVYLHYSEAHDARKDNPDYRFRRGLNPELVAPIVERAQAAGLSVSAHAFTAADFRTAVDAGVEHIAHFPGTGFDPELGEEHFLISEEDASVAARGGITVTTTLSDMIGDVDEIGEEKRSYIERVIRPNLDMLRSAGVPLLIGSDRFRGTTDLEAKTLAALELFDNLELLKSWCEDTPRSIFPDRKIGRLLDGYEASFLVLEGDPLRDFANAQKIVLRVKQGRLLFPTEVGFPPLPGG